MDRYSPADIYSFTDVDTETDIYSFTNVDTETSVADTWMVSLNDA